MKTKEIAKLREKTAEELEKEVTALRESVLKLEASHILGEVKNTREKFHVRHDIARILGIIREKKKTN